MNNDYLKGYINALDHVLEATQKMYDIEQDYVHDSREGYFNVMGYIKEVRSNYKKLVKELNDGTKGKKTKREC